MSRVEQIVLFTHSLPGPPYFRIYRKMAWKMTIFPFVLVLMIAKLVSGERYHQTDRQQRKMKFERPNVDTENGQVGN